MEAGWGADLGYPGLRLDASGEAVTGHVFTSANLESHWQVLDDFEGVEYERVLTEVTLSEGGRCVAHVYVLRQRYAAMTLIHQRVEDCRNGDNPKTIARVSSGWVVLGDVQFLRGYSLLLPDPVVVDLNDLARPAREAYLFEMSALGDALLSVTDACRINYEILGNTEAALHAHVFPRYATEPESMRRIPVWSYDWENAPPFDPERDRALMLAIRGSLEEAGLVLDQSETTGSVTVG